MFLGRQPCSNICEVEQLGAVFEKHREISAVLEIKYCFDMEDEKKTG